MSSMTTVKVMFHLLTEVQYWQLVQSHWLCIVCSQAYEGLQTAHKLKQEYVFLPAKLKEVYLTHMLEHLADYKVSFSVYTDSFLCNADRRVWN